MKLLAPAKINLCLHVLSRRSDGYHELVMLMQRVSLFDELELRLNDSGRVELQCEGVTLAPGEENLVVRAARSLLRATGSRHGIEIGLQKRIPVAAGLGGGSSDAAAVLLGLNRLAGLGCTRGQLMEIGLTLGADVPFFVLEQAAWATGIGEKLDPAVDLPQVSYVLVNPGIPVSTAWVYQNLRLTPKGDPARLREFPRTAEGLVRLLHNDLESVTAARHPEIEEIKARLISQGARGCLMSGSGATVFGLFSGRAEADAAVLALQVEPGWRVFAVDPLP